MSDKLKTLEEETAELKEKQKRQDSSILQARKRIEVLKAENTWIATEREFFGVAGHRYHFDKMNIPKIREENNRIRDDNENLKKRINLKVDSMFEKTEN